MGRHADAIANFDIALKRNFSLAAVFYDRGNAYQAVGELALAERDFATVIELRPGSVAGFLSRGRLRYINQRYWAAHRDFSRALSINPGNSYGRLWQRLAHMRLKVDTDEIPASFGQGADWPMLLLALVDGRTDLPAALNAARTAPSGQQTDRECGVYYYAGQKAEVAGVPAEAVRLYRLAVEAGRPGQFERTAAMAALRRLEGSATTDSDD